jgi:hypothetical protein
LELAGFGQDPGIGAAAMTLELAPILALLVRRVAPQVVAVTYLLANDAWRSSISTPSTAPRSW